MTRLRFSTAREVFETFPSAGKVIATKPAPSVDSDFSPDWVLLSGRL